MAMDDYAEAVAAFTDAVDRAVNRALESMSVEEAVAELRRIAESWESDSD